MVSGKTIHDFIRASLSEPYTSELNGGFFIYILSVIHIPYASCLDCNLVQPAQAVWAKTVRRDAWENYVAGA